MEIVSINESTGLPYIKGLRKMLEKEWGKFPDFEQQRGTVQSPPAILALENELLLGGLVFSVWPSPETNEESLWINGLIIKPEFRGLGIGTELIRSVTGKEPLLYVKTNVLNIYLRNAWTILGKEGQDTILKYDIHNL